MVEQKGNSQEPINNIEKDLSLIPAIIIEDNPDIIYLLNLCLEESGFVTVGTAKNEEEADELVGQLKTLGAPVIFLDGNLSKEADEKGNRFTYRDGKKIGQKIIETDPDIIIVGISADNRPLQNLINFEISKSLLRRARKVEDITGLNQIKEAWFKLQN